MTEASVNIQHSHHSKQKQVDAAIGHIGINSIRKESELTVSTESFVSSSYDDSVTITESLVASYSPRLSTSGEEEDRQSASESCNKGALINKETQVRLHRNTSPDSAIVREEEYRTLSRVTPRGSLSQRSERSPGQSLLLSSSSGGSVTVTVQVVRPCPVKKGPAPAAVTILSPLPVQCPPPTPAETANVASHATKSQEIPQQQQQKLKGTQPPQQQKQQRQEVVLSKTKEEEESQRQQQQQLEEARVRLHQQKLEEATAKRHQKALEEEEARRRHQQVQQEEFRRRLQQQQQLQNQRQREVTAAKLREQQQRAKEEARQRQQNQCAFPTREPQQQQKPQGSRTIGMGSSDRGMSHTAHVQIAGRQAANGAVHENGGARYHHPHPPPHQQQQVRQSARTMSSAETTSVMKTPRGSMDTDSTPAPLFERIVSEEAQELGEYSRHVQVLSARVAELQRIHDDLEHRLEIQSKDRMELEQTLEKRERMWADRCDSVEKERDQWKSMVQVERKRNERLLDQVYRKDKEIHRMIQRKYDSERHPPHGHSHHNSESFRTMKRAVNERGAPQQPPHSSNVKPPSVVGGEKTHTIHHRSPQEILAASGSVEAVRERNVTNSLLDFFGM
mmetsp:Transcript_3752/g.5690  ORF Transcript_3752/g.5690 Transcript_3752/m.5690 type:complete len:620 (-) Transcript_3752:774-2633(-)